MIEAISERGSKMEKGNRGYKSDSVLDELNRGRRVFLKGLIATGVGHPSTTRIGKSWGFPGVTK
jgi:hypothetical protein